MGSFFKTLFSTSLCRAGRWEPWEHGCLIFDYYKIVLKWKFGLVFEFVQYAINQ